MRQVPEHILTLWKIEWQRVWAAASGEREVDKSIWRRALADAIKASRGEIQQGE